MRPTDTGTSRKLMVSHATLLVPQKDGVGQVLQCVTRKNGTGRDTGVYLQLLGTAAPRLQATSERPLHPRDSPPGLDLSASHSDFSLSLPFSLHNLLTFPLRIQ